MPSLFLWSTLLLSLSSIYAQCTAPILDGPSRSVTRESLIISGSLSFNAGCTDRFVRVMTEESGLVDTIRTDDSGFFSVQLRGQPFGTRNYYLLNPNDNLRSDSIPISILCNAPTVERPVEEVIRDSRPTISGRTNCPFVIVEISGQPPTTIQVNSAGEFIVRSQPLANGAYDIVLAAVSDRQGSNVARSEARSFTVDSPEAISACHAPEITSHRSGSTALSTFTISGIVDIGSSCDSGLVRIVAADTGEYWEAITNGVGQFSIELARRPLGPERYYAMHPYDTAGTYRGVTITITIICGPPLVQQPGNNINDPGYNPYADVMVYTSRPVISGYADCPVVTIEVTGKPSVILYTDPSGAFSYQSGQLMNGRYELFAIGAGDAQGAYSQEAWSRVRNFVIQSDDPFPTGNLQRRAALSRNRCRPNEEMCRFVGVSSHKKSVGYECVSDLSSNLERCGSCDGPDCSALPNVNGVSCQEGRCHVHSCAKGFVLQRGACVRPWAKNKDI